MIDFKSILDGLEHILRLNLTGYTITRNEPRNNDASVAAKGKGWIGIYRGNMTYDVARIGATPWRVAIETKVEIQCASARSGEDAEARLQTAETEVLTVLHNNKKINNTVEMTHGFDIAYEYNDTIEDMYHLAAIITIRSEKQTGG